MINRFRRRFSFEQRDRDVVVSNRNAIVEFEFFSQAQGALEPFRALLWIAHRQSKVANFSECEWNIHFERVVRRLFLVGTVPRNERLQEAQVEILYGITRRLPQATGASLQLRPDIGKPDTANHPKFWTQLCARTGWMRFQEIFHVLSDHRWQFFDLEGDHIDRTHAPRSLDC